MSDLVSYMLGGGAKQSCRWGEKKDKRGKETLEYSKTTSRSKAAAASQQRKRKLTLPGRVGALVF